MKPRPPSTIFWNSGVYQFYLHIFFGLFFTHRDRSPSALRKAQDSLSDPKYSGKRVSRAQLLADIDEQPPLSDSQAEDSESDDQSQVSQENESDTAEPSPRQGVQPDVAQTLNQTRQDDQKKGLAVSRQLVRSVYPFGDAYLTF